MRNILEYPVTTNEVIEVVKRAQSNQGDQIGGIDGYALHILTEFLEQEQVKKQLTGYLESISLKKPGGIDNLSKDELQILLEFLRNRKPLPWLRNIRVSTYVGVSVRGSHVYDCNHDNVVDGAYPGPAFRLYVRLDGIALRAELNEDDFLSPYSSTRERQFVPDKDEPVSGFMYFLKTWFAGVTKSTGPK